MHHGVIKRFSEDPVIDELQKMLKLAEKEEQTMVDKIRLNKSKTRQVDTDLEEYGKEQKELKDKDKQI